MREEQPALRVERGLRARVEPLVRVGHAAREREPAEHAPDDDQNEQQREAEPDPPAPVGGLRRAPRPAVRARARLAWNASGAGLAASQQAAARTTAGPSSCRVGPGRRDRASRPPPSGGLGYPAIMSANRVIGVDLGGTKILAGVIDADGGMHETVERPTVTTSQDALLAELVEAVRSLPHDGVAAVGFGIPSRIDHERGIALGAGEHPAARRPVPRGDAGAARPAGRDGERRDLRGLRRVPVRRGAGDAQLPDADARHRRRRRRRLERTGSCTAGPSSATW